MAKEFKDIILHPSAIIAACSTVLLIAMFVINNDNDLAKQIQELQIRQEVLYSDVKDMESNHLAHIESDIENIKETIKNIEITIATLISNQ